MSVYIIPNDGKVQWWEKLNLPAVWFLPVLFTIPWWVLCPSEISHKMRTFITTISTGNLTRRCGDHWSSMGSGWGCSNLLLGNWVQPAWCWDLWNLAGAQSPATQSLGRALWWLLGYLCLHWCRFWKLLNMSVRSVNFLSEGYGCYHGESWYWDNTEIAL